jgi:hypothetical protein
MEKEYRREKIKIIMCQSNMTGNVISTNDKN